MCIVLDPASLDLVRRILVTLAWCNRRRFNYVVFFAERLVAQNKTTATRTNNTGNPSSAAFTWCLGATVTAAFFVTVAVVSEGDKFTTDNDEPRSGTPLELLSSAVAVPGWTVLACAPLPAFDLPAVCGFWVVACDPVAGATPSWSAILYYCNAKAESDLAALAGH